MEPNDDRTLTLVASDVAPVGGMERAAFELCSRLLDRGWNVTVIARSCALPRTANLRFIRLPSPPRPVSLALISDCLFAAIALARYRAGLLQTVNPTILNRVDVITAQFCEAAAKRSGVSRARRASVLYRVNSWVACWIALGLERWCYRPDRVRRVACASQGLVRDLAHWYPQVGDRLCAIANGVDQRAFDRGPAERDRVRGELGLDADALVALFVGGDWHRKGLRHAIEALPYADGWTLVVVGAGDPKSFGELIAGLGVRERVKFVGRQPDPVPYYLAADALVAPSYFEAFSLVALEAAASALPLIVPRMNGTEELVRNGVNGWFTERSGSGIAARLQVLRDDPSLREAMSAAARQSVAPYDWERITDLYEAVYTELLDRPRSSAQPSCRASGRG
jgi:glycosyltransferase involved in cell wall biosynthesis